MRVLTIWTNAHRKKKLVRMQQQERTKQHKKYFEFIREKIMQLFWAATTTDG